MFREKQSPRVERGVLYWFEYNTFNLVIQFKPTKDGQPYTPQDSDKIVITFAKQWKEEIIQSYTFTNLRDYVIILQMDAETTKKFSRGNYIMSATFYGEFTTTVRQEMEVVVEPVIGVAPILSPTQLIDHAGLKNLTTPNQHPIECIIDLAPQLISINTTLGQHEARITDLEGRVSALEARGKYALTNLFTGPAAIAFSTPVHTTTQQINFVEGHVYHIRRTYEGVVSLYNASGSISYSPTADAYFLTSGIQKHPVSSNHVFSTSSKTRGLTLVGANGNPVTFRNIVVIDLTDAFGAGNEPSARDMDIILKDLPDKYFSGTTTVDYWKQFAPLIADKANRANSSQDGWKEVELLNGATGGVFWRFNRFGRLEFMGYIKSNTNLDIARMAGVASNLRSFVPVSCMDGTIKTMEAYASSSYIYLKMNTGNVSAYLDGISFTAPNGTEI